VDHLLKLLHGQVPKIDAFTELPQEFSEFQMKIDESMSRILALEQNFDEKNSPPYEKSTLNRAISFIKKLAYSVWKLNQMIIPIPKILPGPEGSIDVCWKTPTFQLLINFPMDLDEPASYYGDDYGKNTTEGIFDGTKLDQIFLFWLLE
jgi:hypothetical protein